MASKYIEMFNVRWAYEGVDQSLSGNGGKECAEYLPAMQKLCETIVFTAVAVAEICYAYPRLKLPKKVPETEFKGDRTGRKVMLMILCIVFGIEVGFKMATRQVIFLLNPCHMITIMQVCLPPKARLIFLTPEFLYYFLFLYYVYTMLLRHI